MSLLKVTASYAFISLSLFYLKTTLDCWYHALKLDKDGDLEPIVIGQGHRYVFSCLDKL